MADHGCKRCDPSPLMILDLAGSPVSMSLSISTSMSMSIFVVVSYTSHSSQP